MPGTNQFRDSCPITPHTRSLIYRAIKETGQWRGTRRDVEMVIRLADPGLFDSSRVTWRARFNRGTNRLWVGAQADTIRDAIEAIEERAKK